MLRIKYLTFNICFDCTSNIVPPPRNMSRVPNFFHPFHIFLPECSVVIYCQRIYVTNIISTVTLLKRIRNYHAFRRLGYELCFLNIYFLLPYNRVETAIVCRILFLSYFSLVVCFFSTLYMVP